jgi:hypothetical protein
MQMLVHGEFGLWLDVNDCMAFVELKQLVRKCCDHAGFFLPGSLVQKTAELVAEKAADKKVEVGGKVVYVDRGRLFFPHKKRTCSSWTMQIQNTKYKGELFLTGWRQAWQGHLEVFLPCADYKAAEPAMEKNYPRTSSISKLWTAYKVPAFMRMQVPVLCKDEAVAFEFLSGVNPYNLRIGEDVVRVSLNCL